MDWLNKYFKIIAAIITLVLSAGALQGQVYVNSQSIIESNTVIKENKLEVNKGDATVMLALNKIIEQNKQQDEKQYRETKKEIKELKIKQEKTTVMEVKIDYIQKDIKSNKDVLQEILQEMRAKK